METREIARKLVVEMAPSPVALVLPDTELVAELGYDSLGLLELVAALEDVLGLASIENETVAEIIRVADVERLADDRSGHGQSRA